MTGLSRGRLANGLWGACLVATLLVGAACAADPEADSGDGPPDPAAVTVMPSPEPALDECSTENLTVVNPGQLTVGAVAPLEEPYFLDAKPGNGEGFEAALVYAVAEGLGLRRTQVDWRVIAPEEPLDPATARVDFLIGRIAVDDGDDVQAFSQPYLQAVGPDPEPFDVDGEPITTELPRTEISYALAFAPGDPLVICVDGVLGELTADGELQELADTWLPPSDASSLVAGIEAGIPATTDEGSPQE